MKSGNVLLVQWKQEGEAAPQLIHMKENVPRIRFNIKKQKYVEAVKAVKLELQNLLQQPFMFHVLSTVDLLNLWI